MSNYRVRFHLAHGPHFMHWQVLSKEFGREYYNPADTQITMYNCRLRNRPATAMQIWRGGNKTVCAWVDCERIDIGVPQPIEGNPFRVSYNPRIVPHWRDEYGNNIDGAYLSELITQDTKILTL